MERAREKRPISLLGARDKKGRTWHPTLTKHRSPSWGLVCCRYLEVALSIIIPQMRVLVNWYGRFLYSPLGSSQKSLSLFLNSQEWLPPTPPLKINTISKSELNRNFNQNAKISHLQSHLLALYSSLVLRPFAGYTFTCGRFHSFFVSK